jgi:hypothetical protein
MIFARRNRLPLGIDFSSEVSVVAVEMQAGRFHVKAAESRPIPAAPENEKDRVIVETLRSILRDLSVAERRCVVATLLGDAQSRLFRPAPGMRPAEAERAALLETDTFARWPSSERVIALDPIPGASEMLLSVARSACVERVTGLVKLAGVEPVAVDVPLCAWRRAASGVDAVLELHAERAALFVFGRPLGAVEQFATSADERLLAQTRAFFIQARRDGIADVERIATVGLRERCEPLESELTADGYDAQPLRLGTFESPPWALAYGLATWSVLPRERPTA